MTKKKTKTKQKNWNKPKQNKTKTKQKQSRQNKDQNKTNSKQKPKQGKIKQKTWIVAVCLNKVQNQMHYKQVHYKHDGNSTAVFLCEQQQYHMLTIEYK